MSLLPPKILFIIGNLGEGGVSKSMVNLLNIIDRDRYDISLLVMSTNSGLLEPLLPQGINIIRDKRIGALLNGFAGMRYLARQGNIFLALASCLRLLVSRFSKSASGMMLARLFPSIEGEWDVIVDYNGQQQCYYMVDKLKAKRKYTFFHSDYSKWPYYYHADKKYYPQVDGIFTISETCAESLKQFFPEQADKIGIIPNLSSPELIKNMAQTAAPEMERLELKLITVGHLSHNKGTDMALEAGKLLNERGIDFHWFFIGKDSHDIDYKAMAKNLGIDERITFLGLKINPYAYVSKSDIFVFPSRFEGKSIALDEAKILAKPIVVTNFSTVYDQFKDRVNASICEMDANSLANAIAELADNNSLRNSYIENLKSNPIDNTSEISKIYDLLDK